MNIGELIRVLDVLPAEESRPVEEPEPDEQPEGSTPVAA